MAGKSKRNGLAGTGKTNSYKNMSEASRKRKLAYDKEFQKKPAQIKKRVEANAANRKAQKAGTAKVGDNKDYDHSVNKMVSAKVNRGRMGEGNRKTGKRSTKK